MTNDTPQDKSLLIFPCDFTLKIFGHATPEFEAAVLEIMRKHVADFSELKMTARPSKNGKYRALSVTIHATSREQLDNLYRDLSASTHIVMVL